MKKRSQFPKDRDRDTTTSTQESSEELGPLSPPPPNSKPIRVDEDYSHTPTLARGPTKPRKISGSSTPNYSNSQKATKGEEDSANQLFFW